MGYPVGQVDIPGLSRMGKAVEQAADSFEKAHARHADRLAPGAGRGGWSTTAALNHGSETWAAFLKQLAAQVRDLGTGLSSSAQEYQAADQASSARITGAAADSHIPAGHPAMAGAQGLPL